MTNDIQKAGLWKRLAAGILDGILLAVLAAGVAFLLGAFLGYDGYTTTWDERCAYYEEQYSTSFQITEEQYKALPLQEKENYDKAYEALIQDEDAVKAYNMMRSMPLLIITGGILVACLLLEFALPMFFGNGQTVGCADEQHAVTQKLGLRRKLLGKIGERVGFLVKFANRQRLEKRNRT